MHEKEKLIVCLQICDPKKIRKRNNKIKKDLIWFHIFYQFKKKFCVARFLLVKLIPM